jgi:hypothetical protein
MTLEQAIRILHPDTTLLALAEVEYYGGFDGNEARIKACEEACILACEVMHREVEREADHGGEGNKMVNAPLTFDELRGMAGEPVYIHYPKAPEYGRWGIVEGVSIGGAVMFKRDYSLYDYGEQWFAYRQKPEECPGCHRKMVN